MDPAERPPSTVKRLAWGRVVAYLIGLALLGGAVLAVTSRTDALRQAVESARTASPWLVLAVIVLPLANIAAISASFWVLTNRFGKIGLREMTALIVSSWLLNHLPMRPGLVGRVGYQRVVCGIAIKDSVRVIVEQLICGIAALGVLVAATLVFESWGLWANFGALMGLGAALSGIGMSVRRSRGGVYVAALGFRILDMTLWLCRYGCLFAIGGTKLDATEAAAVTVAAQGAMLSPIPLGLREWAVGVAHGLYDVAPAINERGDSLGLFTAGVAADLANRAAELIVCVPLGIAATVWLGRRVRAAGATAPHRGADPSV